MRTVKAHIANISIQLQLVHIVGQVEMRTVKAHIANISIQLQLVHIVGQVEMRTVKACDAEPCPWMAPSHVSEEMNSFT
jgi:hypothetical protein